LEKISLVPAKRNDHVRLFADDDGVLNLVAEDGSVSQVAGGGSQPGAARVIGPFPFTSVTPNLALGVDFYVPTVGDLLLDFWVEITTAWNGTTPLCDIGSASVFASGPGMISRCSNGFPCDLGNVDDSGAFGTNMLVGTGFAEGGIAGNVAAASFNNTVARLLPARFVTADPLQVVVSTDGTTGGSATGATLGASAIYIKIATPAAP
jgi:hypothetical protein